MANILLVATGGVRAPTQIELAERFLADGHSIRTVASGRALRFLGSYMARRPSKIPGYIKRYQPAIREALAYFIEAPKSVPHISQGKWADVVVMAPATSNSVGKLVSGISDNYAMLVLRAIPRTKKVIVVPSMNPEMWFDPLLQRNIDLLNDTEKYRVLCPTRGQMLSGDWGFGAQVPLEDIVAETYRVLGILDAKVALDDHPRAGEVPWDEGAQAKARDVRFLHVEPDENARELLTEALQRDYPGLRVHGVASASRALEWLRDNTVAGVLTEMDFEEGVTGLDLIEHLRRPGHDDVQIIATSTRDRRRVGAERLGRLDVLFIPKPYSVRFVVGMVGGMLRSGARRPPALGIRRLHSGEVLVREGERGTEAFIIREGRLRITHQESYGIHEIGTAGPGEMVGEMAFLNEATRAATLTAMEPTELAVLDLESFRDYLEGQPSWLRVMLRSLTGRLRERSERLVNAERCGSNGPTRSEPVTTEPALAGSTEDLKQEQAAIWGKGQYERIAETLAVMHDELIRRLDPRPGESWLDLAAGTGAVAFRAARKGARVTGIDLAPALVARARATARTEGLDVRFEIGDAERLMHSDASFDVVASAVGVIFAPDHAAVARELARVCRPGGRLGVTAWRLDGGVGDFFEVVKPFQNNPPSTRGSAFDWGSEEYVRDLLGDAFELEVFEFDAPFIAASSEAAWEKLSTSYGPIVALVDTLSSSRREELRRAVVSFYDRFWNGHEVHHSRRYAMLIGKRR